MNSYYCIKCNKVHVLDSPLDEALLFSTGFHYANGKKLVVGTCELKTYPSSEQE
ncbi:DUF3973 domain-containing protein [Paenibacillus sp. NPDC056579]|uniref:DUF3973 domain-containing protein n=1 Tax=Paenibacillus sp. NPDC056579 TaxID=3345871 RepID=UPI00368A791F